MKTVVVIFLSLAISVLAWAEPSPLTITNGGQTVSDGFTFTTSGGVPPFKWEITGGASIFNGTVSDVSSRCGTGTVTVTDACGNTDETEVRFPEGHWEPQSTTGTIPSDYYFLQTLIEGATKTLNYWAPDGGIPAPMEEYYRTGAYCVAQTHENTCGNNYGGTAVIRATESNTVCESSPPTGMFYQDQGGTWGGGSWPGSLSTVYAQSYYYGRYTEWGWQCFTIRGYKTYTWECE